MEQNHELPSSFQETERCFYVCRSGCGRIAFRHRYSPNALFRAYFLFYQCDAKLQTVQWHGGEYDDSRRTRTDCAYLAAEEAKDADALSRCFTEDGTVHDEGRDYRGRDAIRQWKQAADEKYRYVLQMVNAQTHGNEVTVRARLTGEFPGSPVELDHIFKLSNNKIASLEIRS